MTVLEIRGDSFYGTSLSRAAFNLIVSLVTEREPSAHLSVGPPNDPASDGYVTVTVTSEARATTLASFINEVLAQLVEPQAVSAVPLDPVAHADTPTT
jgi:hypothetical protein